MPKPDRFVQSFLCNTGLWQTDGQTDRHTQGRSYSASLAVAAPEGRSRVGFSLCEAAERRRHEERGAEGSRRRRRRDERRRREGRGYPPPHPTKGSGERRKLPQRGLGLSPSRNRFRCILPLKSDLWCQKFP